MHQLQMHSVTLAMQGNITEDMFVWKNNNTSAQDITVVKTHIRQFSVIDSHYTVLYLDSKLSIIKMYRFYKQ